MVKGTNNMFSNFFFFFPLAHLVNRPLKKLTNQKNSLFFLINFHSFITLCVRKGKLTYFFIAKIRLKGLHERNDIPRPRPIIFRHPDKYIDNQSYISFRVIFN